MKHLRALKKTMSAQATSPSSKISSKPERAIMFDKFFAVIINIVVDN